MATDDFFRARLDQMIDLRHPLAVLATRLPWGAIEAGLAPKLAHQARPAKQVRADDLLGTHELEFGGGISNAGRPRLPVRLMASLLYLKHSFNLSDEELVARWAENVQWQFFSGMQYYEARLPCDPTQIGRFRRLLGEDGLEQLLKATIDCAVQTKAVRPAEFERVIVDSTVQSKAIAHPVDSRLLEIARHKVVSAARRCGIVLKQTYAKEGKTLRRQAGGYAHAKQFRRLRKTVNRQRTILGVVMREVQRKLAADKDAVAAGGAPAHEATSQKAVSDLTMWLERAERIRTQQRQTKNKLYALHAPEVECISKGKARNPYEFGVKVSLAVTHKQGLMVGARSFPGNPYDGHVLSAQLEQTANLLQDQGHTPKQVIVDLGYRGVDADNLGVQIIHRGKFKSLSDHEKRLLKRRQAIEPLIGHTKADHRMDRCWLQGALGDALHVLGCAAGYNVRWLLRAITRLGLKGIFCALSALVLWVVWLVGVVLNPLRLPMRADHEFAGRPRRAAALMLMGAGGISQGRLKSARAWRLKMALRQVYAAARVHNNPDQASADLRAWLSWARRCRLEPFKKLATTIKDRFDAVVRGMTDHRSNAFVEAMNGLLQQAKRAARGFRTATNFVAIAYLRMSKLKHLPAHPFNPAGA